MKEIFVFASKFFVVMLFVVAAVFGFNKYLSNPVIVESVVTVESVDTVYSIQNIDSLNNVIERLSSIEPVIIYKTNTIKIIDDEELDLLRDYILDLELDLDELGMDFLALEVASLDTDLVDIIEIDGNEYEFNYGHISVDYFIGLDFFNLEFSPSDVLVVSTNNYISTTITKVRKYKYGIYSSFGDRNIYAGGFLFRERNGLAIGYGTGGLQINYFRALR